MNKEQFNFGDALKIQPIKTKFKITNKNPVNVYNEFQRLHGPLCTKTHTQNRKQEHGKSFTDVRPPVEIKTIFLEMPRFGAESAVIKPKMNQIKPSATKIVKPKPVKPVAITSTHALVKKLSQMEHSIRKDSKIQIHQTASTILDVTNRELEVAKEQLTQIKKMIELKQVQTQTTKPPPSSPRIKTSRHRNCHQKKYLTTLQSMKKKLSEMEKKYMKKPQVMYKSVNDTFTQFSKSVESIYTRKTLSEDEDLDKTLKVAISELDDIVKTDISKTFEGFPKSKQPNNKEDATVFKFEGDSLITNDTKLTPASSLDSIDNYFNKIQNDLFYKEPDRSIEYSKPVEDFLAGEDFDETSSQSSLTPRYEKPKHVRFEHVLAKDWSGDYEENTIESLPEETQKTNTKTNDPNKGDEYLTNSCKNPYLNKKLDEGDNVSKIIDMSEKRLSRYRDLKQDVKDVNDFCDTLREIVNTEDEEEDEEEINKTTEVSCGDCLTGENIFDESKLQQSVLKSCYLMKEFNIKPKVFREESSFCNKSKFYKMNEKCAASGDRDMNNLLENLHQALENSIYTVDTKQVSKMCKSNVVK